MEFSNISFKIGRGYFANPGNIDRKSFKLILPLGIIDTQTISPVNIFITMKAGNVKNNITEI